MVFEGNQNLPLLNLPRCGNRFQSFQQSKLGSIRSPQEEAVRVESDGNVSFSARSIMDSTGMTVTAVGKNVIPGLQGKLPQRFTVSLSLCSGDFEVVANQCGPLQTVVNAPLTARLSWLLDHRRIDQSQRWNQRRFSDKTAFLEQRATKPIQPILAFAQPFEQGYVGKFRKLGLPGPHHGLSHGKTAPQVQQKRAHVVFFTLILT